MIGIDEVGRGCWAGPLLIVAARPTSTLPAGLKDSKKLSAAQRQVLLPLIQLSCSVGMGWVTPQEIDRYGLAKAMYTGVQRALEELEASVDEEIIMDGLVNYCDRRYKNVRCLSKADDLYPIVSAASIVAKVLRDQLMQQEAGRYPDYGFESHVGYGTAKHQAALKQYGTTPLHRLSFKPVRQYVLTSD